MPDAPSLQTATTLPTEQVAALKRTRSSFTSIVKVAVGLEDEQETFIVHEDLIKEHSTFFRSALSKDWVSLTSSDFVLCFSTKISRCSLKNQEKTITLLDQQPDIFRMYLECIYTSGLVEFEALSGLQLVDSEVVGEDQGSSAFHNLFLLWIAADYLGNLELANEVMDSIIVLSHDCKGAFISIASFVTIFSNTTSTATLRHWSLDFWSVVIARDKYHAGEP